MQPASGELAVSLVLQHKADFVLSLPPRALPAAPSWAAERVFVSSKSRAGKDGSSQPYYIYITDQNHAVKT